MMGRGHVGSTRGHRPAGAGPATAASVVPSRGGLRGSSLQAGPVLAAAHHAFVTHRVRAGRLRLRLGPRRLGTGQHPARPGDLLLFGALLAAAVLCIEAMRRLGQPSGVSRDLLSAWWLPIALLLPPIYALLAPFVVGLALYARGKRATPVYR